MFDVYKAIKEGKAVTRNGYKVTNIFKATVYDEFSEPVGYILVGTVLLPNKVANKQWWDLQDKDYMDLRNE